MKKLKRAWLRIPRKIRACLNFVVFLLLAVTFYVTIGSPTLTEKQAFRRAERANLVGPSTILYSSDVLYYDYDHIILGETGEGVITYVTDDVWDPKLSYHEKTGDITVITAPKSPFSWSYSNYMVSLPIFVVDDHPDAARAELDLHITGTHTININGEQVNTPLDHRYALESHREQEGVFHFCIQLPFLDPYDEYGNETNAEHGADGAALDVLAETFGVTPNALPYSNASITATVRLYDEQNALVANRDLILRSMTEEETNGGATDEN